MEYTGRNVVVLGLGLTGFSLARYLASRGATVRVADTRPAPPFADQLMADLPQVPLATGPITGATLTGADLIAISPGIAKDQETIAAAVARGVELVGDVELFVRALPPAQKVLAITGSNGKSTVTTLTGALARAGGLVTVALYHQVPQCLWMLPALWSLFFSLGIFASYRLLPKATFWVGVYYLIAGVLCLVWAKDELAFSSWAMGVPFGLGQCISAAILYWTLERKPDDEP